MRQHPQAANRSRARLQLAAVAALVTSLLVATSPADSARGVATSPADNTAEAVTQQPSERRAVGSFSTRTSEYSLAKLQLKDLPVKVPVLGHVVAPVGAPGPRPLVLFLHGKHSSCYGPDDGSLSSHWPCVAGEVPIPSYRGYDYLQRTLASRGYVTVSIAANAIDGQEDTAALDSGMADRSQLVRHHLRLWAEWADGRGVQADRWRGRVDLSRVLLVGHSRGGEGVDRAAIDTAAAAPWRVAGQVLLAPTAVLRQQAPRTPTVVLLGYCDGDLNEWPGQHYVDRGRDVVPDPALRSAVVVMGANHNFFNTEWTPGPATAPAGDDASGFYGADHPLCGPGTPTRLKAREQRAVARAYVGAAARVFLSDDPSGLPLLDGRKAKVRGAAVHVAGIGGRRVIVRPRLDASPFGNRGAEARLCRGRSDAADRSLCGHGIFWIRTPHWPSFQESPPLPAWPVAPAVELSWKSAGARGGLLLRQPVDLSRSTHLDARVVVGPAAGPVQLSYRLVDDAGHVASVTPRRQGRLEPMPGGRRLLGRLWAQTLRAPLGDVAGIDLAHIRRIALVAHTPSGHIWLLDASGWRPGLAPVPAARVARVNLADVSVDEGDGGARTVDVPVRVDADLVTRARIAVQVLDLDAGARPIMVLTLRPGERRATIAVTYQADNQPGPDRDLVVNTWAISGAVTGDYQAHVVVRDDD